MYIMFEIAALFSSSYRRVKKCLDLNIYGQNNNKQLLSAISAGKWYHLLSSFPHKVLMAQSKKQYLYKNPKTIKSRMKTVMG